MLESEFEPPEEPELLSLGLVTGGITPSNELVKEAFMAVMRGVRDKRDNYGNQGLRINVVYKIPGPLARPDFQGVYLARYARKTHHLLINAAVPESLTFDHVPEFFSQSLKEIKLAVNEYLKKRKISVDTTDVISFIDDLIGERSELSR